MRAIMLGTVLALLAVFGVPTVALAEATQLRISRGFGVHYLPLYVMEARGLLQQQAAANGQRGTDDDGDEQAGHGILFPPGLGSA